MLWSPVADSIAVTCPEVLPAGAAAQLPSTSDTSSVALSERSSIGIAGEVKLGLPRKPELHVRLAWPNAIPANTTAVEARPMIFVVTDIKLSPCESKSYFLNRLKFPTPDPLPVTVRAASNLPYKLGRATPCRAEIMLAGLPQVVGVAVHLVGYQHHSDVR
jgi:hypothetical protein